MLKAKALCAVPFSTEEEKSNIVQNNMAQKVSAGRAKNVPNLNSLVGNMQNLIVELQEEERKVPQSVVNLAARMTDQIALIQDLLHEFRICYSENRNWFKFSLKDKSQEERKAIAALLLSMNDLIINGLELSESNNLLEGTLLMTTTARRFLEGKFLELGIYEKTRRIVERLAKRNQIATYGVYSNVKIKKRSECQPKNEFDIVIRFGNYFYILECKSGRNFKDWSLLYDLGKTYNIVPDRLMLVDPNVSEEKAETIEYFCEYYICNLNGDSLREKITQMLCKDHNVNAE